MVPGRLELFSNVDTDGRWARQQRTLLVHSSLDDEALTGRFNTLARQQAKRFGRDDAQQAVREVLNTVGKEGQPGEQIRCVISVSMLTEGWDARTVTHIVGFRAFSTQLLCEQVTGRALRRTSYDSFRQDGSGLLSPEYADVVGIPFEFMPAPGRLPPQAPTARRRVHTVPGRSDRRITWPKVVEYLTEAPGATFRLNPERVQPWSSAPDSVPTIAAVAGVAGEEKLLTVDEDLRRRSARASLAAELAGRVTTVESGAANGAVADGADAHGAPSLGRCGLFQSAWQAVGDWASHRLVNCDDLRPLLRNPGMQEQVMSAILDACDFNEQPGRLIARLDSPATDDTRYVDFLTTLRHFHEARHSELSAAACHSHLEELCARELDAHDQVDAWARNFQLGWSVPYHFEGAWRRYEPDFVARLVGGGNLIVECKGVHDEKSEVAADCTRQSWIPAVANTTSLPEALRSWHYVIVGDERTIRSTLNEAILGIRRARPAQTD